MQTANHNAGPKARTTRDASLPQESSENTPCDDCGVRDAEGMNPAGRSLCRPCARRAQTLIADGGTNAEALAEAVDDLRDILDDPQTRNFEVSNEGDFVTVTAPTGCSLTKSLLDVIEEDAGLVLRAVYPAPSFSFAGRFELADDEGGHDD